MTVTVESFAGRPAAIWLRLSPDKALASCFGQSDPIPSIEFDHRCVLAHPYDAGVLSEFANAPAHLTDQEGQNR
jgi:hypothetical protein